MKLSVAVWRALVLGVLVGLVAAMSPGCGPPKKPVTCNKDNCPGCCDQNATCFTGIADVACGNMGATCVACTMGQTCVAVTGAAGGAAQGGRCLTGGTTGGGSAGGGSAGGGSTAGGTTGGGSAGGGSAGGAATCNAQTCPNGCCTATGSCQNPPSTARCGMGGAACAGCMPGKSCVAGICEPCNGCIDLQTGRCELGMMNAACGKNGEFCSNCTVGNAVCTGQACVGNMGGCNPSNCDGCCDGQNCVTPPSQTGMQCGQGQAGSLCVSCNGGTCNTMDAGFCVGGTGGGGAGTGGGSAGFDGGFGATCDATNPCPTGECCLTLLGLGQCVGIDTPHPIIPSGKVCGLSGMACRQCVFPAPFGSGTSCNTTTGMCQ